jgi:hypothetical protein
VSSTTHEVALRSVDVFLNTNFDQLEERKLEGEQKDDVED